MARQITKLRWAKPLDKRPAAIPVGRPRGKKAYGVRYERELAKALPWALHGQWFEFEDVNGPGYCQPDLILSWLPSRRMILEVKYSLTQWAFAEAFDQLHRLYIPVVEAAYDSLAGGITVTRNLAADGDYLLYSDLEQALIDYKPWSPMIVQWLGQPLLPAEGRAASGKTTPEQGLLWLAGDGSMTWL